MAFVAFLDTCVLYPPTLRDVLLTFAEAGIFQVRWSPDVLDELEGVFVKHAKIYEGKNPVAGAQYVIKNMTNAFPDAFIEKSQYEQLVSAMTNDEKDRHVLAAAIVSRADILVTFNKKHFQIEKGLYHLEVQGPDEFLCYQLDLSPGKFFKHLGNLATQRREPMNTARGILKKLGNIVPNFTEAALEIIHQYE